MIKTTHPAVTDRNGMIRRGKMVSRTKSPVSDSGLSRKVKRSLENRIRLRMAKNIV